MARSSFNTRKEGTGYYESKVDKDPFYKTLGIFNNIFKKKFRLVSGGYNATDCKENIYVNFGETSYARIVGFSRQGSSDSKSVYGLSCGHEWEGNIGKALDGSEWGVCWICGSHQAYLGFEHEWQHIVFKSDIPAQFLFCEGYTAQLRKLAPHIPEKEIFDFLKMLVNVFDDIRCNSLWEKIYPGSAAQIWQRWQRLARENSWEIKDKGDSFLNYVFLVAFGVPTDAKGPFENLRPIIEWAVSKVKYRGFANMLTQVRVVIEHCMASVLAQMTPPPVLPQPPTGQSNSGQENQRGNDPSTSCDSSGIDAGDSDSQGSDQTGNGTDPSSSLQTKPISGQEYGRPSTSGDAPNNAEGNLSGGISSTAVSSLSQSSAPAVGSSPGDVLRALIKGATPLEGEKHLDADLGDIDAARRANSTKAMIAKVLSDDVTNLQDIDQRMPTGVIDQDMQATIDLATKAIAQQVSKDSQLTDDAKAKVIIIDVPPSGISASSIIALEPETKTNIAKMRAAFFKAMGKQKAHRASEGTHIDVQAYIQYKLDRQDPEVFLTEETQQGFSYSIVCDMSGSMTGTFPRVAQAAEMLRESLDFPFVRGDVWGFRGADGHHGEVWLYRYEQGVRGYLGKGFNGRKEYPVKCGGVTPMNTAINVTAKHQHVCVSEGMAKRMFLLTDGSPLQERLGGGGISAAALKRFVANEIRKARSRGIQVYTIVIGEHAIGESDCFRMFGPKKLWRRATVGDVGDVLASLVLDNFQRYLLHKG